MAYFPKDSTKEFDNDLVIVDWLTQFSEIKDAPMSAASSEECSSPATTV